MKKLVLMASFFMAFAVSAQQGRGQQAPLKEGQRSESGFRQQPQKFQVKDKFAGIQLSKAQQKKIDALEKQRIAQHLYDVKIKQILSKSQYERYLKNSQARDYRGFAQAQHGQYGQQAPKGDLKPFRK